ncbi:MAG: type II toxin-antitoxin system VapC family toxin [Verrucomicrobia bacterium]|nr:type II toxin-antitoxin system VapC family toxin [Verrucomicrobiota bacterium]MCH8514088.1 type II toxin-antitoxin system VapC family toxin [Kiritimatiellia bacterium]
MAWTVDTCVLVDIIEDDPEFGTHSARCIAKHLRDGLVLSPVSFVELGPTFNGNILELRKFLNGCGIQYNVPFDTRDAEIGHKIWNDCIVAKRKKIEAKRPVADVLIGAFAMKTQGLITRNPKDFRKKFPNLEVINPKPPE